MVRRAMLLVLVMTLPACGISVDGPPSVLSVDLGDPGGIEEATGPALEAVSMYLVRDDRLVHITRDLPSPATLESILTSLVSGETDPEDRAGLRSSIPAGTRLRGISLEGTVAQVDLSSDFAAVGGEQELLAVAQVVLTATRVEGVESVVFALDGVRTDVPVSSGALEGDPVSELDYASLVDR